MTTFWSVLYVALLIFLLFLIARFVTDWVMQLARRARPTGAVAATLEVVYSVTDPPLRAMRRIIPPLRLGGMRLDLGFMILFFGVYIGMSIVGRLAA
ncbi:MAG: YggT family protein [Mycobacteriales bacterium]